MLCLTDRAPPCRGAPPRPPCVCCCLLLLLQSGFYDFCAVTFVVALLLYWLVHFDESRRLGDNHIGGSAGGASEIIIRR